MSHKRTDIDCCVYVQAVGTEIEKAQTHLNAWATTGSDDELTLAWEHYLAIFRVAHKLKETTRSIDLSQASPRLLECRDLELAIPGQYRPGHPVVAIRSVHSILPVISSKQKPRKCTMTGSDGKEYTYLLKGHEDLRQDERVMQLFGLMNTFLGSDRECARQSLQIVRYAVMPLSPDSGLIEWVPDCDTLHALIKVRNRASRMLRCDSACARLSLQIVSCASLLMSQSGFHAKL